MRAVVQVGNRVYVGGTFPTVGGIPRNGLASFNASTGAVDPAWNPNIGGTVYALAVTDTRVYAGGDFTSVNGTVSRTSLAAFEIANGANTGHVDLAWNPPIGGIALPQRVVTCLAVTPTKIYAGGGFGEDSISAPGAGFIAGIAVFNHADGVNTGAKDTTWHPIIGDSSRLPILYALAATDTKIYVGGTFDTVGNASRYDLAAFSPADGVHAPVLDPQWRPDVDLSGTGTAPGVYALLATPNFIIVGGQFDPGQFNTGRRRDLVIYTPADGVNQDFEYLNWGPRLTGEPTTSGGHGVFTLSLLNNKLYVGGDFTSATPDLGSSATRRGLAAFDFPPDFDVFTESSLDPWNPNVTGGPVFTIAGSAPIVFAGGSFTSVGGLGRTRLAGFRNFATTESISALPEIVDLGQRKFGTGPSAPATLTILSDGTTTVEFRGSQVALTGTDANQFAITSDSGEPILDPQEFRSVGVAFNPTSLGAKSATIRITTDVPNMGTLDVSLLGVGTNDVPTTPSSPPLSLPHIVDLGSTTPLHNVALTRIYGDDNFDYFGGFSAQAVAIGDLNGDGRDDLIIGAAGTNFPSRSTAGEAYILLSDVTRTSGSINLNTNGAISSVRETRIRGASGSLLGFNVASGDINGDGLDDAVIGAPFASGTGGSDTGGVYVIYGKKDLAGNIIDVGLGSTVTSFNETRIFGDDAGDFAGAAIAVGDVNGDGYDDVIIGSSGATAAAGTTAGEVTIIYGKPTLPGKIINLNSPIGSNGETRILGELANDATGAALACGDVNGDGFDDVIIGAPGPGNTSSDPPGKVFIVYGSATLPATTVNLASSASSATKTRIVGVSALDGFGFPLACGDINADGFDDVIMGATGTDGPGGSSTGLAAVFYGRSTLPGKTLSMNAPAGANGETRILGKSSGDYTGLGLAVSDVNGDGFDDLLIGATGASEGTRMYPGKVYVIYGRGGKPGTALLSGSKVDLGAGQEDSRVIGVKEGDDFGVSIAGGGDFDRDGLADFAAGADFGDSPFFLDPISGADNDSGYAMAVFADRPLSGTLASASERFRTGVAPKRGVGGRLSPVIRTWISFEGGNNGSGGASAATVTLTRSKAGITNLRQGHSSEIAKVLWKIDSNRTGLTKAIVTFQYLDSEITGLNKAELGLYKAPSPSGPWTFLANDFRDPDRNLIGAEVDCFSYFAIAIRVNAADEWRKYD